MNVPVRVGEKIVVQMNGLAHGGEGVGRVEGFTVFVPWAVPGDRVEAEVSEVKKNYARGRLLRVLEPSAYRIPERCPLANPCGGCQVQHIDYREQLRIKTRTVEEALRRIGKLEGVTVHPALGMADPWGYRNKAQFPVGIEDGRVVAGCYAAGTHRIVDVDECLIQHPASNRVLTKIKELAPRYGVKVYNEATGEGLLRHVLVRVSQKTGESMAVLVTNGRHIPKAREFATELMEAVPGLESVVQNINERRTNVVLGEDSRVIAGRATLTDYIGDLRFEISARSFFQVNPQQTEVLYGKAVEYAGLTGRETVIDAYCGIGTISLFLARRAARVYGIEVVPEAIEDARRNAWLNDVGNAEFLAGEVEEVLPDLAARGVRPDVVVVDPPRKGCEASVLETFVAMEPRRIVYVSCNPATMARDLAFLNERGYRPVEVQPVDMFPHTAHVECVVKLESR